MPELFINVNNVPLCKLSILTIWFFDGLGTELVSLAIGAITGGIIGFKIGKRKRKFKQKQTAGKDSEQYQKGSLHSDIDSHGEKSMDEKLKFCQIQKAGDSSKQTQIGGDDNA